MNKISSSSTIFYKKVFPIIWFGFLACFIAMSLVGGAIQKGQWPLIVFPCAMAAFGFVIMKMLVWNLADEVYDCGDTLRVRKGGDEETIPISNIMKVSASMHSKPPRITLRLVQPVRFGKKIAFVPEKKFTLDPFAKSIIAEDLMARVDRARTQRSI